MLNPERKELIRRTKELLARPDACEDKTVAGRRYVSVGDVIVVGIAREMSVDGFGEWLKVYVGTVRIADVGPYNSYWENPDLEESALSTLREHMVLDDLAKVAK
jgi:hypothetical protein